MSLGKKFLSQDRGGVSILVSDILNENNNTSRTITETYTEDTVNRVLSRYFMLNFTYMVR